MQDDFITWPELVGLVALLGGPVIVTLAILQTVYLRRRGVGPRSRRIVLIGAASGTAFAVYVLTLPIWALAPRWLIDWPGTIGSWPFMLVGVFFVPSILAALVVAPLVTWLAGRWSQPNEEDSLSR